MKFSELKLALLKAEVFGQHDPDVDFITANSRNVRPGALFVAVPGVDVDGHLFIADAVALGAAVIVGERAPADVSGLDLARTPYVRVPNSRRALAWLAAAWHDFPARKLKVIGVTGTDGKTTTSSLIAHVLRAAGHRVGLITTVSADIDGRVLDTGFHVTTPDALDTQRYLAEMVAAGCDVAILECTSHGLHQHRVDACEFDVAVITNITHEHLDYHGTWENYAEAKGMLFAHLSSSAQKPGIPKIAVLNADDASFPVLDAVLNQGRADLLRLTYGLSNGAVQAIGIQHEPAQSTFTLDLGPALPDLHLPFREMRTEMHTRLIGNFNVYNILAAACVTLALGVPIDVLSQAISEFPGVVGRMERIDEGQPFLALVDFAHSPASLTRALEAARLLAARDGRVIAVFGSAGLRDKAKRFWMGEISGQLADFTIITAEDPRTESLDAISAEIARGCEASEGVQGQTFWRIDDRAEAIAFACRMAMAGDVVITCGKGHERSMCFGTTETPWDEQHALRVALRQLNA